MVGTESDDHYNKDSSWTLGKQEETTVNARWEDWGKVHIRADAERCVGKWMGFQESELHGRELQPRGVSLEHLSMREEGAFKSAANILQGCFCSLCV